MNGFWKGKTVVETVLKNIVMMAKQNKKGDIFIVKIKSLWKATNLLWKVIT